LPPPWWKAVVDTARGHGNGGFAEGLRRRAGTRVWEAAGKKWTEDMAAAAGGVLGRRRGSSGGAARRRPCQPLTLVGDGVEGGEEG